MTKYIHIACNIFTSFTDHSWRYVPDVPYRPAYVVRACCLAVAAMLLSPLHVTGQNGNYYNVDEHLSSSFVNQIYQDRTGFIWIATRNGLNRYDGYSFRVFKKGMPGCEGIASNVMNCITQSSGNIIYVGMSVGAQIYHNDRFHDINLLDMYGNIIKDYVTSIIECADHSILIGTSGNGIFRLPVPPASLLQKQDMKLNARRYEVPIYTKDRKGIVTRGEYLGKEGVRRLYQSADGTLWILTDKEGIIAINGKKTRRLFATGALKSYVMAICEDSRHNIYIATHGGGLYQMRSWQHEPEHVPGTENEQITALYMRSDGRVMLGLDGDGIEIYDPATKGIVRNPYYHKEFNLSRTKVHSIIEDRNGNMWFGMLQKGVFMQPRTSMRFGYMGYKQGSKNKIGDCCVTSVRHTSGGQLWIGTDKDGIYCTDNRQNVTAHITGGNIPTTILTMCESGGRMWGGSYMKGVGEIGAGHFTPIKTPVTPQLSVFSIAADNDGGLWIATMGQGLLRYAIKDGSIYQFKQDDGKAARDSLANVLSNGYIYDIAVSKDGRRVYVATTMGMCCYDIPHKSWTRVFGCNKILFGTTINCVSEVTPEDKAGGRKPAATGSNGLELWLGTDEGIYIYNMRTRRLEHITLSDGLSSESIAAIQPDRRGAVWVSTMHGLNRIDAVTKAVTNRYYAEDGLQGNEFSDRAATISPDGTLFFGGVCGVTFFKPSLPPSRPWHASILLTDLKVNGRSVTAGGKSGSYVITETTPMLSDRFDLDDTDNNIRLQFSTMTYEACEHITYRYSINNEEWIELPAGTNEISLSHLPAGSYDFCVMAEKDGQHSAVRHVQIRVHSPWYATTWAYALYLLALIGCIFYFLNLRRIRLREAMQQKMETMRRIHAEEMQEAKIRFFMNISHEIRTPMALIISPIMSLIQNDHDPQRLSLYHTIKRNADRILNLINQIMDLRKIEKEQMPMHLEPTEMIGFISEIYQLFDYQARAKSITFRFQHAMPRLMACIDRSNFDKILVNLLSNAFKFTPPGGSVTIVLEDEGDNMRIMVKDTGPGIPPEKMKYIFRRFYSDVSVEGKRLETGTGIGLDLTRQLVLLHHGSITAGRPEGGDNGKGCCFTLVIPRGEAAMREAEMTAAPSADTADTASSPATTAAAPKPTAEDATALTSGDTMQAETMQAETASAATGGEEAHSPTTDTSVNEEATATTGGLTTGEDTAHSHMSGTDTPATDGNISTTESGGPAAMPQGEPKPIEPHGKPRKRRQAAGGETKDSGGKPAGRKKTARQQIVIVEDDEEIREYLARELSAHYTVRTYCDGKEALAGILLDVPSLVVSDIMMPEMDGMTLCSRLKTNINTNHVPVILLTAKDTDEDRMQGIGIGADAYISKPFNLDILKQTILNLLASRNVMKLKFTGKEERTDEVEDVSILSADDKLMRRIMNVVNKNLANPDLTVDDIAREAGLSRVHLYRKMKELTNQSPHQFVSNIRVRQAARLLQSKRHKVSEIMYACGFPNATAFNNAFKAVYGVAPRDYMKKK
ncbi:MAG: two-component regulator propeller domain-containing protein [Prevotella sp.]